MTELRDAICQRVMDRFSHLDFDFRQWQSELDGRGWLGLAPPGRVGVLDVVDSTRPEFSFLFSSAPHGSRDQVWTWHCLIALADTSDVPFLPWVRALSRRPAKETGWRAAKRYSNAIATVHFDPVDIMVLTVQKSRVS